MNTVLRILSVDPKGKMRRVRQESKPTVVTGYQY